MKIIIEPMSADAFAPFGDLLEAKGTPDKIINQGLCGRFHDRARMDSVELRPFQEAIDAGMGAIMTAHISVPSLNGGVREPSTLSPLVLTDILRDEMRFDGIVFTDAAARKVQELILEERNPDLNLRVYISGGGCSGFQYGFSFDEERAEDEIADVERLMARAAQVYGLSTAARCRPLACCTSKTTR